VEAPRKAGIDIVEVLEKFHATHYVPSRMRLVINAPRPLAELRSFVESTFGSIPPKEPGPFACPSDPTPLPQDRMRMIYVTPAAERHMLRVMWSLPERQEDYAFGLTDYFSYILGHEGPGSLALVLKERGWANSVVCGRFEDLSTFSFFGAEVELTVEGLQHVDDTVRAEDVLR
jgi:insulysin